MEGSLPKEPGGLTTQDQLTGNVEGRDSQSWGEKAGSSTQPSQKSGFTGLRRKAEPETGIGEQRRGSES